eukprot:2060361-Amphidinium_carterae.1
MARQVGPSVHRYLENAPVPGLADAVRVPTTPKNPGTPCHTNSSNNTTNSKHPGHWNRGSAWDIGRHT